MLSDSKRGKGEGEEEEEDEGKVVILPSRPGRVNKFLWRSLARSLGPFMLFVSLRPNVPAARPFLLSRKLRSRNSASMRSATACYRAFGNFAGAIMKEDASETWRRAQLWNEWPAAAADIGRRRQKTREIKHW